MSVKLLIEHELEFLSLKGDCTCSLESTLVKMPHCWKSHVTAHLYSVFTNYGELTFIVIGRPSMKNTKPVRIFTNTLLLVSCFGKKSIIPLVTVSNIPNCKKM